MKKVLAILLMSIFLVSTTGLTIHTHLCQGKEKGREISNGHTGHSCCSNPDDMPEDCCNDEYETYKVQDDFLSSSQTFTPHFLLVFVQSYSFINLTDGIENQLPTGLENNTGPPGDAVPLRVLHQSFLI